MKKLYNPTQEDWFDLWCKDAVEEGLIKEVLTQDDYNWIPLYDKLTQSKMVSKVLYKGTSRERTKKVEVVKTLMSAIQYKPDRVIVWDNRAKDVLFTLYPEFTECYFIGHYSDIKKSFVSLVEVKAPPGYGGRNSSDASFRVKQKAVYDKTGAIVNKVYNMPNKKVKNYSPYLWLSTFTPERYLYTDKTLVGRTIKNWSPMTIKSFLERKPFTKIN